MSCISTPHMSCIVIYQSQIVIYVNFLHHMSCICIHHTSCSNSVQYLVMSKWSCSLWQLSIRKGKCYSIHHMWCLSIHHMSCSNRKCYSIHHTSCLSIHDMSCSNSMQYQFMTNWSCSVWHFSLGKGNATASITCRA